MREGFAGLLRELAVVFGSFTAIITAIEGFQAASLAMTWSLIAGALGCGILSMRRARGNSPVADAAPADVVRASA
jgi:hypothetical protein